MVVDVFLLTFFTFGAVAGAVALALVLAGIFLAVVIFYKIIKISHLNSKGVGKNINGYHY